MTNYLRASWNTCAAFIRSLLATKGITEVKPDDPLARYIFSRGHFKIGAAKTGAFLPKRGQPLSVFQIRDLDERSVWAIGREVETARRRTLKARADIRVSSVEDQGLALIPDNEPPRHATIEFPKEKHKRMLKAEALALASTLKLARPLGLVGIVLRWIRRHLLLGGVRAESQ